MTGALTLAQVAALDRIAVSAASCPRVFANLLLLEVIEAMHPLQIVELCAAWRVANGVARRPGVVDLAADEVMA